MVSFHTETKVFFASHSDEFLKKYVEEGDGSDKAGGYGIQEHVSSASKFLFEKRTFLEKMSLVIYLMESFYE